MGPGGMVSRLHRDSSDNLCVTSCSAPCTSSLSPAVSAKSMATSASLYSLPPALTISIRASVRRHCHAGTAPSLTFHVPMQTMLLISAISILITWITKSIHSYGKPSRTKAVREKSEKTITRAHLRFRMRCWPRRHAVRATEVRTLRCDFLIGRSFGCVDSWWHQVYSTQRNVALNIWYEHPSLAQQALIGLRIMYGI